MSQGCLMMEIDRVTRRVLVERDCRMESKHAKCNHAVGHDSRRPRRHRRELAARAAASGRSLQQYLRSALIALADRPDNAAILARVRERGRRDRRGADQPNRSSSCGPPTSIERSSAVTVVVDASVVSATLDPTELVGALGRRSADHWRRHRTPHDPRRSCELPSPGGAARPDLAGHGRPGPRRPDQPRRSTSLPYEPFADRVWQLRHSVTPYDAWYVAIAEAFEVPLATLDHRLANAPGPRCSFSTPPSG